jgi:hypothetical protein
MMSEDTKGRSVETSLLAINQEAPVVGASEIEIAAAPEKVWEVLAAIDRWPSWNPDIKSMAMQGDLAEGSTFRWKAGRATITSTIRRIEPPRLIAWTGKTFGLNAIHVYRLEPRNGKTFVRTEESFEGIAARVMRGSLQKTLDHTLADGLRYLKAEAEKRPIE